MKLFSLLLVAVALSGISCERHEFDGPNGTRQLHEPHGGTDHGDQSDHGGAAGHDEKKPAH